VNKTIAMGEKIKDACHGFNFFFRNGLCKAKKRSVMKKLFKGVLNNRKAIAEKILI